MSATARRPKAAILAAALAAAVLVAGCDRFSDEQRSYATPEQAVDALISAVKSGKSSAMLRTLGQDAKSVIESGDPVQDANSREVFARSYDESRKLVREGSTISHLLVGESEWPFPFALVKEDAGWRFDTSGGVDEIVNRRIGTNEISTIQSCLAYVDAQYEYYLANPEAGAILHYARRLLSTPGQKDGLFWETGTDEPESPLGAEFANARSQGYLQEGAPTPSPYHGYYYRALEAQGAAAAGGAYDYLVGDQMIGGFALLAYPAEYGSSGVMTFIVNHDGVVFSKDLGPDTATLAGKIAAFDPVDGWTRENAL
jgi:hypothetical protein